MLIGGYKKESPGIGNLKKGFDVKKSSNYRVFEKNYLIA